MVTTSRATSSVPGIGMRQKSDNLCNYTVAKITMDCDFKPASMPSMIRQGDTFVQEMDEDGQPLMKYEYLVKTLDNGIKCAFVSCTYHWLKFNDDSG